LADALAAEFDETSVSDLLDGENQSKSLVITRIHLIQLAFCGYTLTSRSNFGVFI
jgi:hypothetical protein